MTQENICEAVLKRQYKKAYVHRKKRKNMHLNINRFSLMGRWESRLQVVSIFSVLLSYIFEMESKWFL